MGRQVEGKAKVLRFLASAPLHPEEPIFKNQFVEVLCKIQLQNGTWGWGGEATVKDNALKAIRAE